LVTATIKKESGKYTAFICKGHSGYGVSGQDIICSAISMLTINTANSIEELTFTKINAKDCDGFISFDFPEGIDEKATLLMDSMVLGLKTIEDTYSKKYLTLIIEEV